jgi:hypothetical protein
MRPVLTFLAVVTLLAGFGVPLAAADDLPSYLRDRGTGMRTSMFASYVNRGEFLVYPFYEYYKDDNQQYSPNEYGGTGIQDLEGKYRANEGILFLGYGITDKLAIEVEMAYISATFEKDPLDTYGTPPKVESSGVGDLEGQITFRFLTETEKRPELYTFFEAVVPHDKTDPLVGTEDWEFKLGVGGFRGFGFGTLWLSAAAEYTSASSTPWDLGETQLGYIRRVNPQWRVYAGIEGQATDEASLITEVQRTLSSNAYLKANLGLGLTSNATDFAPEVGVMFSFPTRK